MANKDRGGKSSKTPATRDLKEKRAEKKAKRASKAGTGNQSMDKTFGS